MAIATRSELVLEADPEDVDMSSARLRNVTNLVQSYIDEQKLPGALSLVARNGKIVHLETYGNLDQERTSGTARHDLSLLFDDQTDRQCRTR